MANIGWIGTGVMGAPMAAHLQEKGNRINVFNRTKSKAGSLIKKGAKWCNSPFEVALNSEIIFSIVSFPEDVEEIYLGERGVLSADGPCKILVDMSTSHPSLAQTIAQKAEKKGLESLDAPVSGGDTGARNGTLAIMAGGKKEIFDQVLPLFELMGTNISYMGGHGAGQHTKMCNQILVAGNMIGVCESLLYASRIGLEQQSVIDIIGKGAASSWLINNVGPRIVKGDYEPGFFVEHFIKDMGIALHEAAAIGLSLPGLALVQQLYLAVKANGHARSGTQALFLALQKLNGS